MAPIHRTLLAATCSILTTVLGAAPAFAQFASFTRPTDTVLVPGNTVVGTEMTIEALVWLPVAPAPGGVLFDEQRDAREDKILVLVPGGMVSTAWRGPHSSPGLSAAFAWPTCQWAHVAFVSEGLEERLYLDGALVGSLLTSGTIQNDPNSAMAVGGFQPPPGSGFRNGFLGAVDWLRVSSSARYSANFTPPAVQPDSDASTLLLYHFSEAPGATTIVDQGPNGWDGTVATGFAAATSPSLGAGLVPTLYCTAGTTTNGCRASLSACGTPSVTAGSGFVVTATGVEGQKNGLLFYGTTGRLASPWGLGGTSLRCVRAPTQRTGLQGSGGTSGSCDGSLSLDWNTYFAANPAKAINQAISPGSVVDIQAWFRDPGSPRNTSLSDGCEFIVRP